MLLSLKYLLSQLCYVLKELPIHMKDYKEDCFKCRNELLKISGTWDVLTEVVAALQNVEGSVKRQWLVDAVEISCVSSYPSTVGTFVDFLLLRKLKTDFNFPLRVLMSKCNTF